MNFRYLFLICLSLYIFACGHRQSADDKEQVVSIDFDRPAEPEALNKFLKGLSIRFIPLETNDSSLFSTMYYNPVYIQGNNIVIGDGYNGSLLRFDRSGKFILKCNKRGNGPQEYSGLGNVKLSGNYIYVYDRNRILKYDLDFNFAGSVPVPSVRGFNLIPISDTAFAVYASFMSDYQLYIVNNKGEIKKSFFPQEEHFANTNLSRGNNSALGILDGVLYISNYFDPSVYFIEDTVVKRKYRFDFGKYNIPDEFFNGDPRDMLSRYSRYRDKMIESIDFLAVTDRWIVFHAFVDRKNQGTIYYDRYMENYVNSKYFTFPFSNLLRNALPLGVTEDNEYFYLISGMNIKKTIEELSATGRDYRSEYPFFDSIDADKIRETDNNWIMLVSPEE